MLNNTLKRLLVKLRVFVTITLMLVTPLAHRVNVAASNTNDFTEPDPIVATTPTQAELQTVYSKSVSALNVMTTFWQKNFSERNRRFVAPRVMTVQSGAAYYQASDHTIYFNPSFFVVQMRSASQQTNTDGDMAFIVILAHEYGHAVQRQLNQDGDCRKIEGQADQLVGAFVRNARDARLLDPGDLDEATYTFFSGRDQTGQPNECPHGSGSERVRNFFAGFEQGVNNLGLNW